MPSGTRFIGTILTFGNRNVVDLRVLPTAAKAAGRVLSAYIRKQAVFVSPEVKAERQNECNKRASECFDAAAGQCRVCHCFISSKSALSTERCPRGHWKIVAETG